MSHVAASLIIERERGSMGGDSSPEGLADERWVDVAMSAEVIAKLRAWVEKAIPSVHDRAPLSFHVDAFLGDLSSGASPVGDAIQVFGSLVLIVDLVRFKPMLVVPLIPSDELDPRHVEWSEAASQLKEEPPSLYLLSRDVDKFLQRAEEYRCPVARPVLPGIEGDYASYYRCYRSAMGREWGWDFERCLYLEAYPPELLFASSGE